MLLALLTLLLFHTESNVVAVPAGTAAELTLTPTHGCGESPTVEVTTRVGVPGATAGEVPGWAATAADDGDGNTVLTWTGGSLPADQAGAFPVAFTAPDAVGELLLFPFVQTCADGQELAWINGDPDAELPAPRVLVLPEGSAPAFTIDEVAPDAPGREQLAAIVDVDNPAAEPTTTTTTTATTAVTATDPVDASGDDGGGGSGGGSGGGLVALGIAIVIGAALAAVLYARRHAR